MKKSLATLFLILVPTVLVAQDTGTLKGRVVDAQKLPLPGANVLVVGTTVGTAADANGEFVLTIAPGTYAVRASLLGYVSVTRENVTVRSKETTTVDFTMTSEVIPLGEEVVVVGYGVQKKRELTGAVSSVQVAEIQKIPVSSPTAALQGTAPGVNVSYLSGQPGLEPVIKIRGTNTLNNNNPLYIIDGVPSDLKAVNPNDIVSMDVLKDASSAAIYGSRSANGVILVTTRRGKPGDLAVTFNTYLATQDIPTYYSLVTNPASYVAIAKSASDNAGIPYPAFVTNYEANPSAYPGTDWQKEYFQTAPTQKYDLGIAGGTESFNFYVSGMYANQGGLVLKTRNEKMSFRVNSDFTKGILKIGESFSVFRDQGRVREEEPYDFYHLSRMSPLTPVKDPGTPSGWAAQSASDGFQQYGNIIGQYNIDDNLYDNFNALVSGYVELSLPENFKYTMRLSQNIDNEYIYFYNPTYYTSSFDQRAMAQMQETRSRLYHTVWDNLLTYDLKLDKHSFAALIGYSREKEDYRSTGGFGENFPSNDIRVLDGASDNQDVQGSAVSSRLESLFGRLTYDFDDKYLFQFNIRRDGSSRFAPDDRYGTFPSVSLGWRISKEPFFEPVPYVTDLKLRGSYGELGNQLIPDYAYFARITRDNAWLNYPFGPGPNQQIGVGARMADFPSYNIKWESTKSTDVGLDLSMFSNTLGFTFDYYWKTTSDILYAIPIPISTGASSNPIVNSAEVKNDGLEIGIDYRNFDGEFKYTASLIVSTYNNEVTKLGEMPTEYISGGAVHWSGNDITRTQVGHEIGSFYLYQTNGLFRSDAEVQAYRNAQGDLLQPDAKAGDLRFVDTNGDGIIDSKDKVFMGSGMPGAEYGLNLTGSWGGFDASIFLYAVTGKKMYNGAQWLTSRLDDGYHAVDEDLVNAWSPSNPNSDIPRVIYGDGRNTIESEYFLEDASFFRLRHIEIGYTIPGSIISQWGLTKIRVYLAADNLFTISGYTGYDPAIDYGDLFSRGVDRSPYPIPRQFSFGLQLKI